MLSKNQLSLCFLFFSALFNLVNTQFQRQVNLISTMSIFVQVSQTKVISQNYAYVCSAQKLTIINLLTQTNFTKSFSLIPTGMNIGARLICYDVQHDDSILLMGLGTLIIKFDLYNSLTTVFQTNFTNILGRLQGKGRYAVINQPALATVLLIDFQTMAFQQLKPNPTSFFAIYYIDTSPDYSKMIINDGYRLYAYTNNNINGTLNWTYVITLTQSYYWAFTTIRYSGDSLYFVLYWSNYMYLYDAQNFIILNSFPTSVTTSVYFYQFVQNSSSMLFCLCFDSITNTNFFNVTNLLNGSYQSLPNLNQSDLEPVQPDFFLMQANKLIISYTNAYVSLFQFVCPNATYYDSFTNNCFYSNLTNQIEQSIAKASYSIGVVASLPIIRHTFRPFNYILSLIDNLWFYQYQNRTYGESMKLFFQIVRNIQNLRFSFLMIGENLNQFQNNIQKKIQSTTNYSQYANPIFLSLESQDNTFLTNLLDYFLFSIPSSFLTFILMNRLFYMVFNYEISKYLRKFAFPAFIVLSLTEENVECFFYFAGNSIQLSFFKNWQTKLINILWILLFFCLLMGCSTIYYLIKKTCSNNINYFYQNSKSKIFISTAWIFWYTFLKKMSTGFSHSFFNSEPFQQIIILISLQVLDLIITFCCWKIYNIFKNHLFVLSALIKNMLLILLQLTFLFASIHKNEIQQSEKLFGLIDKMQYTIISALSITSIIFSICACIPKNIKLSKQDQSHQQKQGIFIQQNQINNKDKILIENKKLQRKEQKISTRKIVWAQEIEKHTRLLNRKKEVEFQPVCFNNNQKKERKVIVQNEVDSKNQQKSLFQNNFQMMLKMCLEFKRSQQDQLKKQKQKKSFNL